MPHNIIMNRSSAAEPRNKLGGRAGRERSTRKQVTRSLGVGEANREDQSQVLSKEMGWDGFIKGCHTYCILINYTRFSTGDKKGALN